MTAARHILPLLALLLAAFLQACSQTAPEPAAATGSPPDLSNCCTDMEEYPDWFVDVARTAAPELGRILSHVTWRPGHLKTKSAAQSAILARLQPLDIVLVSSKGRSSGQLIPGLFGHAAIYTGTKAQLQALGVWSAPKVRRHAADVETPKPFVEADHDGVHLSPASLVLNTDRVAILRPSFASPERRRQVARAYFAAIGTDFDFLFDVDTPQCTFCIELVHRAMPELKLPVQELYGVNTILPDRVAVAALRNETGLRTVAYIKADWTVWRQASASAMAEDIAAEWSRRKAQAETGSAARAGRLRTASGLTP